MNQLELFEPRRTSIWERAAEIGRRVPANVRLGTSSWSFPGWTGIVWSRPRSEAWLAREGLREYASQPLFRTVGLDRGYYAPIPEEDLRRYAAQLPADFRLCAKVPVTVAGRTLLDGRANADFLNPQRLWDEHVGRLREHLGPWLGPVILEIPRAPPGWDTRGDLRLLDRCLREVPGVAVELRDRHLLGPEYAAVLRENRASHVYNWWTDMPWPAEQRLLVPMGHDLVIRLLLPPGTRYADRKAALEPFDRLVDPNERMRTEVLDLVTEAIDREKHAYVIANNKAEGSSPLTLLAMAEGIGALR